VYGVLPVSAQVRAFSGQCQMQGLLLLSPDNAGEHVFYGRQVVWVYCFIAGVVQASCFFFSRSACWYFYRVLLA